MRGVTYQSWHAVLAWISLGDDEAMFLEAAEDLDVRRKDAQGRSQAELNQVKDKPEATISLGTEEARTTLRNFWRYRSLNEDRVYLRYLTRARRAFERTPFPSGRRGLDVWDAALHDDGALEEVRGYLLLQSELKDDTVAPDLIDFLRDASADEVREDLISRVRWGTDAPSHGDLKGAIVKRLVLHGSQYGILPSLAESVAAALFAEAQEVAGSEGSRRLTRTDFLDRFETVTHGLQPARDAAQIAAAIAREMPQRALLTPGSTGFLERVAETRIPDVLARAGVITALLAHVHQSPIVAVIGSSGMGKSTLAELAAARSPAPWLRLDLRGFDPEVAADRIDQAALASIALGAVVLVDDLDATSMVVEGALRRLYGVVLAQSGRMVVTAAARLPHALAALAPPEHDPHMVAPSLSEEDLRMLVRERGCPEPQVATWSRLLLIRTSGHPLLVDVYARDAARDAWPPVDQKRLRAPVPPIDEVQRQARGRLREALPTSASELAIRLSVFTSPFTRDHALRLAAGPPKIGAAGESLDRLKGPWIEPYGPVRYRVSPLLRDAFQTDLTTDAQTALRVQAAAARFVSPITGVDISAILMQAVMADHTETLVNAFRLLDEADAKTRHGVLPYIDWFGGVYTGEVYRPFDSAHPNASLVLRQFQFRVAYESGLFTESLSVLDAWEQDLERMSGFDPDHYSLSWLHLHTHLVADLELAVGVERAGASAQMLVDRDSAISDAFAKLVPEGTADPLDVLSASMLADQLLFRCARAPDVTALLRVVDASRGELREALVAALRARPALTMGLVGRVWSNESTDEVTDWDAVLATYTEAFAYARTHGLTALTTSVAIGQAIVHAEHREDRPSAQDALDAAEAVLGYADPRAQAYRSKMLAQAGDHEGALAMIKPVLQRWRELEGTDDALDVPGSALVYDFSDAVRWAGLLGRYDDAARWAAGGAEAARTLDGTVPSLRLGYIGDQALALAMSGKPCDAVLVLVQLFEELPDATTLLLRKLYRRLTVLIGWLEQRVGGRTIGFRTPELGQLSRVDEDEFPDVGLLPLASLWTALGEVERHAGCGDTVRARARAMRSEVPDSVSFQAGLFAEWTDLVHGAPPDLGPQIVRLMQRGQAVLDAEEQGVEYIPADETPALFVSGIKEGANTVFYLQSLAMTGRVNRERCGSIPLAEWKRHALGLGIDEGRVAVWFQMAMLPLALVLGDEQVRVRLLDVIADDGAEPSLTWVAALGIAESPIDPKERRQALAFLVDQGAQQPFRPTVAAAIATLAGVSQRPNDRDGIQAVARALLDDGDPAEWSPTRLVTLRSLAAGGERGGATLPGA